MSHLQMSDDQQTVERDGVTFYAVPAMVVACNLCVFDEETHATCKAVFCQPRERADHHSVVFVSQAQYVVRRMKGTS